MCHDGQTGKGEKEFKFSCPAQGGGRIVRLCKKPCNDPHKWKKIPGCPRKD